MKKKGRKRYIELAFLVSLTRFLIQIVAALIAASVIHLFHIMEIVPLKNDIRLEPISLIFYMISISIASGLITILITIKISADPLTQIIQKIEQLASGDFKARLNFNHFLSQSPVLVEFADSFNRMAHELEKTEMLRGDFVNNFSHEFKTPIVSIAGFASALRKGNLTKETQEQYLAVIEEESRRLSALATNILNLTNVENQTILTNITRYNISEQIRSCILLLADKWERKRLQFKLDFREYEIDADEELLKQVWINLIDNAIKFSPQDGMIEIDINSTSDILTICIINFGEEILVEDQKQIFNKFYQADHSHSSEGNGIGLAIVKRVIALHKGDVSVQSENGLTMFTVQIPKRRKN